MRILVTNDDGIDSIGLHVLARRMTEVGDVVVVAPDREYSGFGAALGTLELMTPEVHEVDLAGVPAAWSVAGAPALCVFFARLGVFGSVDVVVSGINPGVNTGRAIYHSGTVGAALTARNGGIPALAVSQTVAGFGVEGQGSSDALADQHWDTAAEFAAVAAPVVAGWDATSATPPPVLNLNVPNCALDELAGWTDAAVGTVPPRAVEEARLVPKPGHAGAHTVEMRWGDPVELPEGTDGGSVERNLVAVTHLRPFAHEPHEALAGLGERFDRLFS